MFYWYYQKYNLFLNYYNNDIKNININPIERIIYNKWLTRKERLS